MVTTIRNQVWVVSGVAALTLIQSPAERLVTLSFIELLETVPFKHEAENPVRAQAYPLAVAKAPDKSVVVPPPFGVNFWILTELVPVVENDPITPVPPQTSTSWIVAAFGTMQAPEKLAATRAVADCVSLSMTHTRTTLGGNG
jgi:hypothetical protein